MCQAEVKSRDSQASQQARSKLARLSDEKTKVEEERRKLQASLDEAKLQAQAMTQQMEKLRKELRDANARAAALQADLNACRAQAASAPSGQACNPHMCLVE